MPYNFNPHRHVKIWLSKDQNSFLNTENQLRLVRMRANNPSDEINFIFDSTLLSAEAIKELRDFCKQYNIIEKDVRNDIFTHCSSEQEINLIRLYKDEVGHLGDEGGNLAVASDILRWLSPIYRLGTYTDFDVEVKTKNLPKTIPVHKPLLLNIGSLVQNIPNSPESIFLNNDTIAVVDESQSLSMIKNIQKTIYSACSDSVCIVNTLSSIRKSYINILGPEGFPALFLLSDMNYQLLKQLSCLSNVNSMRQVRAEVLVNTDSIASTHTFLERVSSSLLQVFRDQPSLLRMQLLKISVMYSSGPFAVLKNVFEKSFYSSKQFPKYINLTTFSHYGLDKAFISKNSIPLHATMETASKILGCSEIGKMNDLSWLEEGQKKQSEREENIKRSVMTLEKFYRAAQPQLEKKKIFRHMELQKSFENIKEEMQTHIGKIEQDLWGIFGFYRKGQRLAKINALKNILLHFDSKFDIVAFECALNDYRTKDVFASLGLSKTKILIEKLADLSKRAKQVGYSRSFVFKKDESTILYSTANLK